MSLDGDGLQSLYLHGHKFWVLATGDAPYVESDVADNLDDPPLLGTVLLTSRTFVKLRWRADNPGLWLFESQMLLDQQLGLQTVFDVAPRAAERRRVRGGARRRTTSSTAPSAAAASRPASSRAAAAASSLAAARAASRARDTPDARRAAIARVARRRRPELRELLDDAALMERLHDASAAADATWRLEIAEGLCAPDGFARPCAMFDGRAQGPTMDVNVGDVVEVTVVNRLASAGATVHFHGVHQVTTPYYDGAGLISQAPIAARGGAMTYRFLAYPPGTHWYHGHVALDYMDGLRGLFVVHDERDAYDGSYDDEEAVMFSEWIHMTGVEMFAWHKAMQDGVLRTTGATETLSERGQNDSLVNGIYWKGGIVNGVGHAYDLSGWDKAVTRGRPHRQRVVPHPRAPGRDEAAAAVPRGLLLGLMVDVAARNLTIIAVDGTDVLPVETGAGIVVAPGERYDVLVTADKPCGNYTVLFHGHAEDKNGDLPQITGNFTAVLEYALHVVGDRRRWRARRRRPPAGGARPRCRTPRRAPRPRVRLDEAHPDGALPRGADRRAAARKRDAHHPARHLPARARRRALRGTSTTTLSPTQRCRCTSPRATTRSTPRTSSARPSSTSRSARSSTSSSPCTTVRARAPRRCARARARAPRGRTAPARFTRRSLSLARADPDDKTMHSIHLHGNKFWVLAVGAMPYVESEVTDNLVDPPLLDTSLIYKHTFLKLRFAAVNPGMWHFHCHLLIHMNQGLQTVFNVASGDQPEPPASWWDAATYGLRAPRAARARAT